MLYNKMCQIIGLHFRAELDKGGQALIELAVFGTLFLLIMATLLNYGLRYNYQQRASMVAFRRALKIASDPERGSASYMISEERHIPDPGDMYAIGTKTPIVASAMVTRDPTLHHTPDDYTSLYGATMDIQDERGSGVQSWKRRVYKMSGFRIENNVPTDSLSKYNVVYGQSAIMAQKGADNWVPTTDGSADKVCISSHSEDVLDWEGNVINTVDVCDAQNFAALRITDSCIGQTIDYGTCYKQSRMLVDEEYCRRECERDEEEDCASKCGKRTNPPNQDTNTFDAARGGAWYAANYPAPTSCNRPDGTADRCYTFPILKNNIFSFAGGAPEKKSLGLQSDFSSDNTRRESFSKDETYTGITTREQSDWTDVGHKTIYTQEGLRADGYEDTAGKTTAEDYAHVVPEIVDSTVTVSVDERWQTSK